jgi:hypothetical protein
MNQIRFLSRRTGWWYGLSIAATIALSSCGASPTGSSGDNSPIGSGQPAASVAVGDAEAGSAQSLSNRQAAEKQVAASQANNSPAPPATQTPQLIKTADLSLRLASIDDAVEGVRKIVQSQRGNIYNLEDDRSADSGKRQANLVLKVPSAALDDTLAAIARLGQVQSKVIKSADVTQQLVDTDARLKNLRQQEELTRKIMERSGSVKDILAVSQQLGEIRQQIEQLDASVKNLRQQVAYSTINLKIEEIRSNAATRDPIGSRVQETWTHSTTAAVDLFTNFGLTLLWLLPFSPVIALAYFGGRRFWRVYRRRQPVATIVPIPPTPEEAN